jgi:hypothetical protein
LRSRLAVQRIIQDHLSILPAKSRFYEIFSPQPKIAIGAAKFLMDGQCLGRPQRFFYPVLVGI